MLSCVSTHHQQEQMKHRGDDIHSNMHEVPLLSCSFLEPILPSAQANLRKLVPRCLESLTVEVCLVCYVPFSKQPFRHQITDLSKAKINYEIPLLGAGALLVDDAHGLGYLPDALHDIIVHPLCCRAPPVLPNRHGFCCPLADFTTFILGPDADLASQHLHCIRICDD